VSGFCAADLVAEKLADNADAVDELVAEAGKRKKKTCCAHVSFVAYILIELL
jgi:hypothetical protein